MQVERWAAQGYANVCITEFDDDCTGQSWLGCTIDLSPASARRCYLSPAGKEQLSRMLESMHPAELSWCDRGSRQIQVLLEKACYGSLTAYLKMILANPESWDEPPEEQP